MKFRVLWLSFESVWVGTGDIPRMGHSLVRISLCASVQNWTKQIKYCRQIAKINLVK